MLQWGKASVLSGLNGPKAQGQSGVEIATSPLARDCQIYSRPTHFSSLIAQWASGKIMQKINITNNNELC